MCVSLWVIGGKDCLVAPPTVRPFREQVAVASFVLADTMFRCCVVHHAAPLFRRIVVYPGFPVCCPPCATRVRIVVLASSAVIPTGVIVECSRCVTVFEYHLDDWMKVMAAKNFGPDKKKGMKADTARKTSQAQSMAMDKVKAKKSAGADTKRKTAEAKTFAPAKKAPSSYALGLTQKTKPKK